MDSIRTDPGIQHLRDSHRHGTDRKLKAREHRQCGECHRGFDLLRLPSVDRDCGSTYQSGHGDPGECQKGCPNVDTPLGLQFLLTGVQDPLLPLFLCRREFDLSNAMQGFCDNMRLVVSGSHYGELFLRVVFGRDTIQWL